jgi:hypothetical protein
VTETRVRLTAEARASVEIIRFQLRPIVCSACAGGRNDVTASPLDQVTSSPRCAISQEEGRDVRFARSGIRSRSNRAI